MKLFDSISLHFTWLQLIGVGQRWSPKVTRGASRYKRISLNESNDKYVIHTCSFIWFKLVGTNGCTMPTMNIECNNALVLPNVRKSCCRRCSIIFAAVCKIKEANDNRCFCVEGVGCRPFNWRWRQSVGLCNQLIWNKSDFITADAIFLSKVHLKISMGGFAPFYPIEWACEIKSGKQ